MEIYRLYYDLSEKNLKHMYDNLQLCKTQVFISDI